MTATPSLDETVVITCALTGGMTVPSQSPWIPISVQQNVEQGLAAVEAGASVLHIHVRDEETGEPTADLDLFQQLLSKLAEHTDAVLQPTTGGGRNMTIHERAAVLSFRPEMATFNVGSFNFGLFQAARPGMTFEPWEKDYLEGSRDYVFRNTFADMEYMAHMFADSGTRPEIEVYDVGHIYNLKYLLDAGLVAAPFNLQFVLGVLGANVAEPDQLIHMLRTAERVLGRDTFTWSAAGVGYPGEFNIAAAALLLGGNVRVGLEDNLRVRRRDVATSNADLVRRAVDLARHFDRRPSTPSEVRQLLGLKGWDQVQFSAGA